MATEEVREVIRSLLVVQPFWVVKYLEEYDLHVQRQSSRHRRRRHAWPYRAGRNQNRLQR